MQATYLTGKLPREHGIVGNGWYFRDESEVKFWRQSNKLVTAPKIWDIARQMDRNFTAANICWWFAMYSSADYTVTPRPMYPADGRKLPDVWTEPAELRKELQAAFGAFPLFNFWGPATSIESTRWIVDAAIAVDRKFDPTLTLVYLPHLDYCLQKLGPGDPRCSPDLNDVDAQVLKLIEHFAEEDTRVIILSEYGVVPVSKPIHINRILRKLNLITIREELGKELLDAGDSQAFAVADHQIAHVYINDRAVRPLVEDTLRSTPGIAHVYSGDARKIIDLDHPRAGDLIVIAESDAWFTYYYWLDDAKAPDFARTVDIHRKPGYDPAELFIDPKLKFPKLKIAWTLAKKKLGFRSLLDIIPLDATLVRGSHGGLPRSEDDAPILITNRPDLLPDTPLAATDVFGIMLSHLTMP